MVNNFIVYSRYCEQSCRQRELGVTKTAFESARPHSVWDKDHYTPPPHSLQFTIQWLTPHPVWIVCTCTYSTVIFHDTMQVVSKDGIAVNTVRTYVYVCGHLAYVVTMYNSEDTCKTMLLHVCYRMTTMCSTTLNIIYAYICTYVHVQKLYV